MKRRKFKDHKAQFKNCDACPLHKVRRRIVLGKGKLPCDVLFIGEAPGTSEDVLGKPFTGPAGKLLDEMLEEVVVQSGDFTDLRFAYTNLIGCVPKEEKGKGKVREPDKKWIQECYPRLNDFVELARPKLIVCVGKMVSKSVSTLFLEHEAMSIIHPAVILRADVIRKDLMIQQNVVELADMFEIKFGD